MKTILTSEDYAAELAGIGLDAVYQNMVQVPPDKEPSIASIILEMIKLEDCAGQIISVLEEKEIANPT